MRNKVMVKLIAFDLDGTIGDTVPMCIAAFNKAVSPYLEHELSEREIIQTFGLNEEGMIKSVARGNWEEALNDFYVRYQEMHTMCPNPFDGMRELITELKGRNIILALVTGKGERSCQITLKQFGMESCFDYIGTGSPDRNVKTEVFLRLLAKYKLRPEQMLYVGDTVSDIASCNQANIQCLSAGWVKSTDIKQLEDYNAGNVFQSIQSLKTHIYLLLENT
jgi:phosphoglycolate phosphatase